MTPLPVLLLFARTPAPGKVKTRLCPPLSPEEASSRATARALAALGAEAVR